MTEATVLAFEGDYLEKMKTHEYTNLLLACDLAMIISHYTRSERFLHAQRLYQT